MSWNASKGSVCNYLSKCQTHDTDDANCAKNGEVTKLTNLSFWYFYLPCVSVLKEVISFVGIGNDRGWHHHWNSGSEKYFLILAIWLVFFPWGPSASTGSEILFRCITVPFHSRNCINAVLNHSLKSKWVESAFHYTTAWILQFPFSVFWEAWVLCYSSSGIRHKP